MLPWSVMYPTPDAAPMKYLVAEAVERRARARLAVKQRVVALRGPGVARAADVRLRGREAGRHVRQRLEADVAARESLEFTGVERFLLAHAGGVHHRSGAADRDGLFQRADLHRDVHRGREACAERDAVALHGREPGQRERHRICAGPQVDDAVSTFTVGGDRTDLFNQGWAGRFDCDAWHRQTRRVAHHARNATCLLRPGRRTRRQVTQNCEAEGNCSRPPLTRMFH